MSRIRRYLESPVLRGGLIAGTIDIGAAVQAVIRTGS